MCKANKQMHEKHKDQLPLLQEMRAEMMLYSSLKFIAIGRVWLCYWFFFINLIPQMQ